MFDPESPSPGKVRIRTDRHFTRQQINSVSVMAILGTSLFVGTTRAEIIRSLDIIFKQYL